MAWLANPYRKGEDDMGLVYGAVGRNFPKADGGSVDLLRQIVDDLKKGVDNRGEIYTFYHPGVFHMAVYVPAYIAIISRF
ncbi:thymidylate synthase [Actinobacillus pleuropneumoniae]|nr:thymidylate synthase [Actinobacillus pleuropneumoniae]